jgi:hypothetical protein
MPGPDRKPISLPLTQTNTSHPKAQVCQEAKSSQFHHSPSLPSPLETWTDYRARRTRPKPPALWNKSPGSPGTHHKPSQGKPGKPASRQTSKLGEETHLEVDRLPNTEYGGTWHKPLAWGKPPPWSACLAAAAAPPRPGPAARELRHRPGGCRRLPASTGLPAAVALPHRAAARTSSPHQWPTPQRRGPKPWLLQPIRPGPLAHSPARGWSVLGSSVCARLRARDAWPLRAAKAPGGTPAGGRHAA